MKKLLIILLIVICFTLSLSSCQLFDREYIDWVEIPREYPDDDIEIYDDGVVFFAEEDSDEITIKYGTEDDLDDIIEFFAEMSESVYLVFDEQEEGKKEYHAKGYGCCYDFEIEAKEAKGDKEEKYYETVVEIKIEYFDERIDLMEDMQGIWFYCGGDGEIQKELNRYGVIYDIDDNEYRAYMNSELVLAETGVFYLDDGKTVTVTQGIEGTSKVHDITFETIDGVDVMTEYSEEIGTIHLMKITEEEKAGYESINQTWLQMKGGWQYAGMDGVLDDEYRGMAYDFHDFEFDVYADLALTNEEVLYHYLDMDTFEYLQYGALTENDVKFETIDGLDVMTFVYSDGQIHFKKTTIEDYKDDVGAMLGAETLESIQGLWYMIGIDGEIAAKNKDMGFAYEFRGNLFDTYNNFVKTNFDKEFKFTDTNTFEYITTTGDTVVISISFETMDGIDVMTYSYNSFDYHFIKVDYEEFVGYERPIGEDTLRNLQGFWQMAGDSGSLSEQSRELGFAYEFIDNTFSTYSDFELSTQNTEFSFVTDNEITYLSSNGQTYTADIKFENIDNTEVMTYTVNGAEYHFVKTEYNEYIKGAELSKLAIGFWMMIGQSGSLSDEVRAEGNAIEFTKDEMTTYAAYEVSIETDDYVIEDNKIIYDFGTGTLTANIEFKTVDGIEVLCATILFQEYYFIRTTYDDFISYKP